MLAWLNGELLTTPDAPALSVLDHGLIVGDGVFETIAILRGSPFALTRHLDRLTRSARGLGIADPDLDLIRQGIKETVEPDIAFGRIRVTVTSGPGPLGSPRGSSGQTVSVAAEPIERGRPTTTVVTSRWTINENGPLAGLKTTSYAGNARVLAEAAAHGATEGLMANTAGHLCEGTGSNVFYVLGGELVTPTLASGCLAGVTRALVLQWCAGELPVVERDAPLAVLQDADEVFLVSTTRDVQGVSAVDGRELPAPGPMTARAAEIFAERAAETVDP